VISVSSALSEISGKFRRHPLAHFCQLARESICPSHLCLPSYPSTKRASQYILSLSIIQMKSTLTSFCKLSWIIKNIIHQAIFAMYLLLREETRVSLFVCTERWSISIQPSNRTLALQCQTFDGWERRIHLVTCLARSGIAGGSSCSRGGSSFPTVIILDRIKRYRQ